MNLIRHITLPNGRSTTNLGFGCAGLMRTPTASGRERLVRTAFDAGITHFDVARMYGDGLAESFVGNALKPVRDQATIATKFGLPYTQARGSGGLKSMAKFVMHQTGLKGTIKKLMSRPAPPSGTPPPEFVPNRYTVAGMEESLAASLAQLQTDHVDLFFVHEPGSRDVIADELAAALVQKRAGGQIGAFGISAGRAETEMLLSKRADICGAAIQHPFDLFSVGPMAEPVLHTYSGIFGVFGTSLPVLEKYLAGNRPAAKFWSNIMRLDLTVRENLGVVVLAMALNLNPKGMVLFSTSNPERLERTVDRLFDNDFREENLREFRRVVSQATHAN